MRSLGYWMGRRIPRAAARGMTTAVIALALAGCATGELSDLELAPEQATYRLGAGDKLKITVYGEERLTGEYSVSGEGIVAFPLVGEVAAVGKTLTEFESLLAAELGDGLINDPSVTVEVANYRPYYILGEVARPGEYPFADSLTVFSAVARAGGFTYRASQGRVYIRHKDGAEEVAYRLKGSMPVQPGDTIRVPERHF